MMVLDEQEKVIQDQIKANTTFILRFVPLRPIRDEEWCLLDMTLRLIADYGAIGGKTVFKPSDEPERENKFHHRDFGLIRYLAGPSDWKCKKNRNQLDAYVTETRWRRDFDDATFSWASIRTFWFVKDRYLARQNAKKSTYNTVLGRKTDKSVKEHRNGKVIRWSDLLENGRDPVTIWLAGRQQESKRVFSFKRPEAGRRTFGFVFVGPGTLTSDGALDRAFNDMKERLRKAWPDLKDDEFLTGDQILEGLCKGGAL